MKSQIKNNVIAIVGQTASGKSDLAVSIAHYVIAHKKQFGVAGAEIISADSRQVYKGLDIGSGKITLSEMKGVTHHMLSITSPARTYTSSQFQKTASKIISSLHKKNIIPIVCGGSGFYIDALLFNYQIPSVPPNIALRKELENLTTQELVNKLSSLDPVRVTSIDIHNRHRLIRALEVVIMTGKPTSPLVLKPIYNTLWLGTSLSRETIQKKIHIRLLKRLKIGMIDEVKHLHTIHKVPFAKLDDLGLEYRFISRYLRGLISHKDMVSILEKEIAQFAKRQQTWFRRNKDIIWLTSPFYKNSLPLVKKFLQ